MLKNKLNYSICCKQSLNQLKMKDKKVTVVEHQKKLLKDKLKAVHPNTTNNSTINMFKKTVIISIGQTHLKDRLCTGINQIIYQIKKKQTKNTKQQQLAVETRLQDIKVDLLDIVAVVTTIMMCILSLLEQLLKTIIIYVSMVLQKIFCCLTVHQQNQIKKGNKKTLLTAKHLTTTITKQNRHPSQTIN